MYHIPRDVDSPQYSYSSSYRSTPSYALIPHSSSPPRQAVQYTTTRYHSEPARYRSEPHYVRYHSDPRLYDDSRDHIEYDEQRYVIPYSSSSTRSKTNYRSSHRSRETYAPVKYSRYNNGQTRAYRYRSREVVGEPIPVCACVIM